MSSNWNYKEKQISTGSWLRSWRQEFYTDYNSDFAFVAHIEEVTADENGNKIASINKGSISRKASEVMSDPDVMALNELLTKLVKKWIDEDEQKAIDAANYVPPVPEVIPEEPIKIPE